MNILQYACLGVLSAIYCFLGLVYVVEYRKNWYKSILIFATWPMILYVDWVTE